MKKYGIFLLIIVVIAGILVWITSSSDRMDLTENIHLLVLVLLIGFALWFGYRRIRSMNLGQPVEDEMSKRIRTRAAATAYYSSLYLWLAISYFGEKHHIAFHTAIGLGILLMAVVFVMAYLFHSARGLNDE
ncbi:MAG TPA: hypothetical protein P5550_09955 [Bacteroidales bacterium]|nr:hypothetical protein [Bacteroidales bacterium]HRZ76118.1 hypothetical protein [Bacteroidales bacterium]